MATKTRVKRMKAGDYVEVQWDSQYRYEGHGGVASGDCGIVVDDSSQSSLVLMIPEHEQVHFRDGGLYIQAHQVKLLHRFGK